MLIPTRYRKLKNQKGILRSEATEIAKCTSKRSHGLHHSTQNNFLMRNQYSNCLYHILINLYCTNTSLCQNPPPLPPWTKMAIERNFNQKKIPTQNYLSLLLHSTPRETSHGNWERSTSKTGLTFLTRSLVIYNPNNPTDESTEILGLL